MANVGAKNMCENIRELPLKGYIGVDSLPEQSVKQYLLDGFAFNILCVGETGIGKSTLISSLFSTGVDIEETERKHSSVSLTRKEYDLQEKAVRLKLNVVETVGYGDQINNENSFGSILKYVDSQFERYLQEELSIRRSLASFPDTRIHLCLYFICPTGHSLKSFDLICMKNLAEKVNVIPLIAKADTLSVVELQNFKLTIRNELQRENVDIYQFPTDDELIAEINSKSNDIVPFAVVGSTDMVVWDGKLTLGRSYPWGTVCIENENHSDFSVLRESLIQTNLDDFIEQTHAKYYENYRKARLGQLGYLEYEKENEPFCLFDMLKAKTEDIRREFSAKEEEIVENFMQKVKEKEEELKYEESLMRDKYKCLNRQIKDEKREIDAEKNLLDLEIDSFKRNSERKKKYTKSDISL